MAEDQERQAVVCYAKCWPCQFGDCFDPPQAHTWMDEDDAAHAGVTLPVDPNEPGRLCGCDCARVPAGSGGTPEPTDG